MFEKQQITWSPFNVDSARIYLKPFRNDLASKETPTFHRADHESSDHLTFEEIWARFGFPERFYIHHGPGKTDYVRVDPEKVRDGSHLRWYKERVKDVQPEKKWNVL